MDSALAIIAGGRPVKQVCDVLGVARSNVSVRRARPAGWQDRRSAVQTNDVNWRRKSVRPSTICRATAIDGSGA